MLFALIATSAALFLLALTGWIGYRIVAGRQHRGAKRLVDILHVHSKWWHDTGAQNGELLYVAVGDSAAQGIGASRPGRSYVGLIAEHLRATTGRTVRVMNLSQSGAKLYEALTNQVPILRTLHPDVVTVSIGANDIAAFEPARFTKEVTELCSALPAGTLVADLPCFHVGGRERSVRVANSIMRTIAVGKRLTMVPLYATTRRRGTARTVLRDVAADFFHPNDRGYGVWASAFLPLLPSTVKSSALH